VRSTADRLTGVHRRIDAAGAVALTFDDGPDPVFTPQILDVLKQHDVRATFFLVGQHVERHPQLARTVMERGHAIGSHSHTHQDPTHRPLRALIDDYRTGKQAVERAIGQPARMFRPPLGVVGVRGALAIRACRLKPWRWSVDPQDWRAGLDANEIVEAVGQPRAGDVVLLHDGIATPQDPAASDRSATVAALSTIIGRVHASGLRFSTLEH